MRVSLKFSYWSCQLSMDWFYRSQLYSMVILNSHALQLSWLKRKNDIWLIIPFREFVAKYSLLLVSDVWQPTPAIVSFVPKQKRYKWSKVHVYLSIVAGETVVIVRSLETELESMGKPSELRDPDLSSISFSFLHVFFFKTSYSMECMTFLRP